MHRMYGRPRDLRALVLALLTALPAVSAAAPLGDPVLRITGMTFVGSRGSARELVVQSRSALLRTDVNVAELEEVNALVTAGGEIGRSFTLVCDRAEFDLDSSDFLAEGHVRGETGDGQRYAAPWVRYEHAKGVLYSDAPVQLEDGTGSFRGDGFRYHLAERRFQLLGNVRVEQSQ